MVHYITYIDVGIEAIACTHSANTIRYGSDTIWNRFGQVDYALTMQLRPNLFQVKSTFLSTEEDVCICRQILYLYTIVVQPRHLLLWYWKVAQFTYLISSLWVQSSSDINNSVASLKLTLSIIYQRGRGYLLIQVLFKQGVNAHGIPFTTFADSSNK